MTNAHPTADSARSAGAIALVTGGATGIGHAVCQELAAKGVSGIAIPYRRSAREAHETVEALAELGVNAKAYEVDIRDDHDVAAMVASAVDDFGRLDYVVNAAGTTRLIAFPNLDQVSEQDWQDVYQTNVQAAFNVTRAAAGALTKSLGAVVNVGSIAAHRAVGSSIPYGVSKAGLLQLTRGLALALAPHVRVNSVSPGTVASRWLASLVGDQQAQQSFDAEGEKIPLGRVATATDVAHAVVALLALPMVTGVDLVVDGGKHLLY